MSFSIRLNPKEEEIAKEYAKINGMSLGEAFKKALFEKIEDEYDIEVGEKAYSNYLKNPQTVSLREIEEKLK